MNRRFYLISRHT